MLGIEYEVHVENIGWMSPVRNGVTAGTKDQSLRIEAIKFRLLNKEGLDVALLVNSHIENKGWIGFVGENEICGTVGEALKLQALQFALRGADADKFAVQARAENVQNIGQMDWVTSEGLVGTVSGDLRLEALEIIITDAGVDLGNNNIDGFRVIEPEPIVPTPQPSTAHGTKSGSVYLAVGHGISSDGNWDCGCVDGNYTEADLMLAIGKVAVGKLREWGIDVASDADTDNDKNIIAGVALANSIGTDIYISLHCDYNAAPSGTLPIIYPGSATGERLANCVNNAIMARMGIGTRGTLQESDQLEVNTTNMTACIFETGSIRADIDILLNAQAYGEAVAQGIYDYF